MTPGPYRISYSDVQRSRIRELEKRAESLGRRAKFVRAIEHIVRQLTTDPIAFGDPTHSLKAMKLQMFTRVYSMVHVAYGVDSTRLIVYLRSIDLFPSDLGL